MRKVDDIQEEEDDEIIATNWSSLVIESQKKNNHVFHRPCLNYIIMHYDSVRMTNNLEPIPRNIVWTDKCPTQYECRQTVWKVATFATDHNSKSIITHTFVQKYVLKGSQDATGK